ncbi:hypothetical protein FSP39_010387, partial [Pinctada imbricata]
ESAADAERAITTLNGFQLENKRIKVALARPSNEYSKGANLYVQNIPLQYREEELQDQFQSYGNVIQTRVLVDQSSGQSRSVGFVLFSTKEEAEQAMNALNGTTPPGGSKPYLIKFADNKAKKVREIQARQQQNVYQPIPKIGAGNMYSGGPLRNPTGRFGGGRFNPMGGASGYGGGAMSTQRLGGAGGGGGRVLQNMESGYILFVYNIGYDADEKLLWQLFAPLGTVQKVNVIMDHAKGQCKGYGFVTMPNLEEAQYAIECMNGYMHNGRQLSVSFKT